MCSTVGWAPKGGSARRPPRAPRPRRKHAEKLIATKLKNGYQPVGDAQPVASTPTEAAPAAGASELASAVDAWRAFAAEMEKNPLFAVKCRFGEPITDRALARVRKAWAGHTLPTSMVDFLRVVDGFDMEVREADPDARVFLNLMEQDPPAHHFWGSKLHAKGPPDLLFGENESRPFLVLDEPAAEWCYGFLMLGDVGDNPRVSYHAAAEESVETMDDLAGYLETSLAKTQAAVAEAERLLGERESARSPNPARSSGRSAGLSALASLAVHALEGGNKKRLKKSQDPAKVQALEVQVKDPKEPFDLALLDGFTALELLTIIQAPASIKLAPLQSHKPLSELALSMDVAAASETSWLPDLAEVTLPSVQTAQLWNLGRVSSWSALRAFPNVRELELSLSGSGHEIESLDIWPEAEAISIVGDGEGVQLSAATRLPSKLQRLALSSLALAHLPKFEGGAALLELDLDWNCIGGTIDWSASLPQLTSLRLMHNQIEGISTLQGLPKLRTLALDSNQITKLRGLDELRCLGSLSISKNRLTAIENLAALHDLEYLNLADNKISVVAGLEGLGQLKTLDLSGNPLTDIDAGLAQVADGCEVRLVRCGLSAKQSRALEKEHGKRLKLELV